MSPINLADIVKAYDVRGLVPDQLDTRVANALGSAFAQVVVIPEGEAGVVIGWDMRDSSPGLADAFAAGVAAHGVDVSMIGLCSTDVLYYASGVEQRAGAMFTASHNPAGYNGIKLCRRGARPVGQDSGLTEIRDLAQWLLDRSEVHDLSGTDRTGAISETDMLAGYAAYLHSLVDLSDIRPLRVVVDAGNGMAGLTVPVVLGPDGLPITVVPLYFELDGTFPHHEANPLEPENLRDLQAAVLEHGADLGLAFDGDADRCFVIDERGEPVSPSAVTALVAAREISRAVRSGQEASQVAVVYNTIVSRAVPETIEEHGARPVRSRVGHSFIKDQMAQHGAVFGGEHSAHYYFQDFWFADTGMLAALHVLAALGEQDGPLSQLVAGYDRYAASGELNSKVADVDAATERVRAWAAAQGASEDRVDGLSMVHEQPYWSFSLRPSNTEPLLRLNVEAQDRARMEDIRDSVLTLVRQEE